MLTWGTIKLIGGGVILLALLGTCGYYVWSYHHMKSVIADQQTEIANLKLGLSVLDAKQLKFDEFMAKSKTVQRRIKNEQETITQEVGTVDDSGLNAMYDKYRVRQEGAGQPPKPRGKGGAQHPAP